eukprot:jgi/Mesvir1/14528/Mv05221-RA.1
MEAVKQGSAAVGVQSATHAVLATLKRSSSELSAFQRKVFKLDDHMGIAISGLTADGRKLSRYMRSECINHKFVYDSPLGVARLVTQVADKSQWNTQRSWKRPYGVGLLVIGYDQDGPHLFQTCPTGNFFECRAMAIGSRSQAAKTYLEKTYTTFDALPLDELCKHALRAVKESCPDGTLTTSNCTLAYVGKDCAFKIVEGDDIKGYIDALSAEDEGTTGDEMKVEGGAAGDTAGAETIPPTEQGPKPEDGAEGGEAAPMES